MEKYIHSSSCQFFAFNIWDIDSAKAVIDAAKLAGKPIILQTSMKVLEKINAKCLRTFISEYSSQCGIPVYLHLDHCKKDDLFHCAIENGWDSVMIDASDKPIEENISLTNSLCKTAHAKGVLVESEIGHIVGVEDGIVCTESGVANIQDVSYFITHTYVDMLAVAIGTAHGLYHGLPVLHYELLDEVAKLSDLPLVIHGGTGLTEDMFIKLLSRSNVKKINISTDVKLAYLDGITKSQEHGFLEKHLFDPLKVTKTIHDTIGDMVSHKLFLIKG